jgi:hypothetical protein
MVVVSGGADTSFGGCGWPVLVTCYPLHRLKCFWWWGVDICGLWIVWLRGDAMSYTTVMVFCFYQHVGCCKFSAG